MKIFDKANWHIDAGADSATVTKKFEKVFSFLSSHEMLSEEGREIYDFGIDSSIVLHELMVTDEGNRFLTECYDNVIGSKPEKIVEELEKQFAHYKNSDSSAPQKQNGDAL